MTALPAMMRAARWHAPGDVRVERIPTPRPAAGEVLVRVELTGICGSDLEEYRDGPPTSRAEPLVLGHEVVGTVVACPGGEWPVGTRVVPDVVVGCGTCWWCRRHEDGLCERLVVRGQSVDGGLAEYLLAQAATAIAVPDALDTTRAAFAEPVAVAVRALRKAGDLAGAVVCVVGAGTIGNLVCQVARGGGPAAVVAVDPVPARRALALDAGATVVVAPGEAAAAVAAVSGDRGADVVVECAGVPDGVATAVALSRRGGTVVLVGLRPGAAELSYRDVVLGERRVLGSAAHVWDVDVAAAVSLLAAGRVDPLPLLTATIPLDRVVDDGFRRLVGDRDALKILARPDTTEAPHGP
jgi:2-desacetyl-2-hydroxyethyl bacteriochlorophyllide A dehydrogenase